MSTDDKSKPGSEDTGLSGEVASGAGESTATGNTRATPHDPVTWPEEVVGEKDRNRIKPEITSGSDET